MLQSDVKDEEAWKPGARGKVPGQGRRRLEKDGQRTGVEEILIGARSRRRKGEEEKEQGGWRM